MRPKCHPGQPLRRAVPLQLQALANRLAQQLRAIPADSETAIHEARKQIKALRAWLRLLKACLAASDYQALNQGYRDLARALAPSRDAQVTWRTWQGLSGLPAPAEVALSRMLQTAAAEADAQKWDEPRLQPLLQWAQGLQQQLEGLETLAVGRCELQQRLRRRLGKARQQWCLACHQAQAEDWHQARKRIKDLYYQLKPLKSRLKRRDRHWIPDLKRLGDALGQANDLAMLQSRLAGLALPEARDPALVSLIETQRQQALLAARRQGQALLEPPARGWRLRKRP